MNQAAVALLTQRLPGRLIHPGDPERNLKPTPIPLPGLSNMGMPPDMAQHFADEAGLPSNDAPKLLAEAIIACIEAEDLTIIPNTELDNLRQAATDAPDGTRIITVHCQCDHTMSTPLLELTIGKTNTVTLNGKAILQGLAARTVNCPHKAME